MSVASNVIASESTRVLTLTVFELLPASHVIETELSIEDGISLILSVGASVPATLTEKVTTKPS